MRSFPAALPACAFFLLLLLGACDSAPEGAEDGAVELGGIVLEDDAMAAQLQDVYQKEYDLPVIGLILERLNAGRDQALAQEASNKELVEGLSSQRAQLKSYLQQLYAADQQVEV